MTKKQFELDGINIEIHRKPIKNLYLRVNLTEGKIKASAPLRLDINVIHNFLLEKRDWIIRQQLKINASVQKKNSSFSQDELHFFLGKTYPLRLHEQAKNNAIFLKDDFFHIFIKSQTSIDEKNRLLNQWYRQQFKKLIPPLIAKWEPVLGVKVCHWGIKAMKTRWGTCNKRASRIWLNLYLIKQSLENIEYVLVHEMIHLIEPSHNKHFYILMDKFLPHWKLLKKQLEG